MSTTRFETVTAHGGTGRLIACRGAHDAALVFDGAPVAILWRHGDAAGVVSVVRAHDLGDLEVEATVHHPGDGSLAEAVRPLLHHLPDGTYTLTLVHDPEVVEEEARDDDAPLGDVLDWAGLHRVEDDGAPLLLATVPEDGVDPARVRALARDIAGGRPPLVVLLATGPHDDAFVIHGHAAMRAWRSAGQLPAILRIDVHTPGHLGQREADALLASAYDHVAELVRADHVAAHRERLLG